ncbi:hypothetical protein TNCT_689321 [Trichonephila clavata]|uniref:Uncharacterized protein n=1 Tax=Trichonephila clavata TaxID=2740835 RepID=A0A8X6FQ73_TRICU|nr:hypothetical protein TNCT_689321 [Trichonephila clavata]
MYCIVLDNFNGSKSMLILHDKEHRGKFKCNPTFNIELLLLVDYLMEIRGIWGITYQYSPCRRLPRDELPGPVFRFGHKSYFISTGYSSSSWYSTSSWISRFDHFRTGPGTALLFVPAAEESKCAPNQDDEESRHECEHARQKETPPLALLHALLMGTQGARHVPLIHPRQCSLLHETPASFLDQGTIGNSQEEDLLRLAPLFSVRAIG